MPVNKSFPILSKLFWTLSVFFLKNETWISLPRLSIACTTQSVDLSCKGAGCRTPTVTVSGIRCSTSIRVQLLPCDLDISNEYVEVYKNGVYQRRCNPNGYRYRSPTGWYNCGNIYHSPADESFAVYLKASRYVFSNCRYYTEGINNVFTVYGRIYFSSRYFALNHPTSSPTSPTVTPTIAPTRLPTMKPTPPALAPTWSPCADKMEWCSHVGKNGMCYDEVYETRQFVIRECPLACGTCYNSTLGPTSVPTSLPTVVPTSPTWSPSREPSKEPTHLPSLSPTASPTCKDNIQFCDVIETFCNSSNTETKLKMTNVCAATCGSCSLEPTKVPTLMPSYPCVDSYAYCYALTQRGACYDENLHARLHFQNECPVSCGTCNNRTISPTTLPSPSPTISPTMLTSAPSHNPSLRPSSQPTEIPTASPTCIDAITYCDSLASYCNSSDPDIMAKMLTDCAATCGFCTLLPTPYPTNNTTGPSAVPTSHPSGSPSFYPTVIPTPVPSYSPTQCNDSFLFCNELALMGACYDNDTYTRKNIHEDCPVSCGTCHGNTVRPTGPPTIMPSARPTKQPSCEDSIGYCRKITQLCSTSDSVKAMLMKKHCSETCGFCRRARGKNKTRRTKRRKKRNRRKKRKRNGTPRPARSLNASSVAVTRQRSNKPSQFQLEGERGDRRREADGVSSSRFKVGTDGTQILRRFKLRSFNNSWNVSIICFTLASLLAVIMKCSIVYFKRESKEQGDFVTLNDDEMVHEAQETSYIALKDKNAHKVKDKQTIDDEN